MKTPSNLLAFPHAIQTYEHDCGAAVLQSVLMYYGIEVRKEVIFKRAKTNSKVGTLIKGMVHTLDFYGLKHISAPMTLDEVKKYLDKKIPVILLVQGGVDDPSEYPTDYDDSHWVVAIGYDKKNVYLEDPYAYSHVYLTHAELAARWHGREGKAKHVHHGIAAFGKKPTYNRDKIVHMA